MSKSQNNTRRQKNIWRVVKEQRQIHREKINPSISLMVDAEHRRSIKVSGFQGKQGK